MITSEYQRKVNMKKCIAETAPTSQESYAEAYVNIISVSDDGALVTGIRQQ
jgi:hypothetical protein